MFADTYRRFRAMRPSVRSLVFIYWIYDFTIGMAGIFVQLFLYQRFSSLELNIIATIVFYTGIMFGFCLPGVLATFWRANIKYGFPISFACLALALLYLAQAQDVSHACLAMFFWGFGQGIFWLTVNTFELLETKPGERDYYSSVLSAGAQILGLAGPACATLLIWLSGSLLNLGTYTLLFVATPAVYLIGLPFFSGLRGYVPPRIRVMDLAHYFKDRASRGAHLYVFGKGVQDMVGVIVPQLAMFAILGTALKVGIFDTFFAVFSAVCVLALARIRTNSNRLLIYGLTLSGLALATTLLGFLFTLSALIAYTATRSLLGPLANVSSHVLDLAVMETGKSDTDFYATMLIRDFFLWIWRSVGGLLLLLTLYFAGPGQEALSGGLYLSALIFVVTFIGAYLFLRHKRA